MQEYPIITEDDGYIVTDFGNGHKTRLLKSDPIKGESVEIIEITPTTDDILAEILLQTTYTNCLLETGM